MRSKREMASASGSLCFGESGDVAGAGTARLVFFRGGVCPPRLAASQLAVCGVSRRQVTDCLYTEGVNVSAPDRIGNPRLGPGLCGGGVMAWREAYLLTAGGTTIWHADVSGG
jgi:hypothetical protein